MATELGVDLPIRSTFGDTGTAKAVRGLKDVEEGIDKVGRAGKKSAPGVREMVNAFAGLAGVAVAIQQFKEGFEAVAKQEQSMNALAQTATRLGDSQDEVKAKVTGLADAMKQAAGIDDSVSIPAMIRHYQALGNIDKALAASRLAADVHVGGLMSMEEANDLVTKAMSGSTEGLKKYGIVIDQSLSKKKQAQEALEALEKKFGGSASSASGAAVQVAKLKGQWEDLRNALVEKLMPVLLMMGQGFASVLDIASFAYHSIVDNADWAWQQLKKLGSAAKAYFTGDFAAARGHLAGIDTEGRVVRERIAKGWDDLLTKQEKRYSDANAKIKLGYEGVKGLALGNLSEIGDKEKEAIAAKLALEKAAQDVYERWHKALLSRKEKELEAERAAGQKSAETAQQVLSNLGKFWAEIARGRSETAVGLQAQHVAQMQSIDAQERVALQKLLDDKISSEATIAAVRERYARERILLGEATAAAEQEQILTVANTALGAAAAIFGDHKEIAIAQAIVNTYEGASKALAQGGIYGTILAAVVIAAGLAQVAKISSTNPRSGSGGGPSTTGRGFDDPSNDAAARMGGARWARDMVREWTSGVSAGWAAGLTGGRNSSTVSNSSTVDQSRHYNLEFSLPGVLDVHSVEQGKQLRRTLDSVGRQVDDGRILSRRA